MKAYVPPSTLLAKGLQSTALVALLSMSGSPFLRAQDQGAPASPGQKTEAPGLPGGPRHGGHHLLPPRAAEILNLTAEQKQQLKVLEEEVQARIQGILTPGQLEQLKQMRPPRHGKPDGSVPPSESPSPAQSPVPVVQPAPQANQPAN